MNNMIGIRLASGADLDPDRLDQLTRLINEVYADAEAGMWIPSALRTNHEELSSLIGKGNLMLAEIEGVLDQ